MKQLSKSQLQSHNPWWIRPELVLEDTKIVEFEGQRYKWWPSVYYDFPISQDAILTLRGPRQVGKTTFLKLLIKKLLLEEKLRREAIFFYPCDRIADYNELHLLLSEFLAFARPRIHERLFIFLDEISFVKEWQRAIKELVDAGRLKNALLLLTGSNILDIKFSSERLPGRRGEIFKPDIEMLPLDFSGFLDLVCPDLKEKEYQEIFAFDFPELQKLFEDFLLTGGFLSTINQFYTKGFIPAYIYEMYINWIEGDLHKTGKSDEVALRIFERLVTHLSGTISFYKLAKESGIVSHLTVRDYLDILEKIFVLFKVEYFSIEQKRVDSKKNRKMYYFDPFILQAVMAKFNDFLDDAFNFSRHNFLKEEFRPKIAEMLVGATLKRRYSQLYYGVGSFGEIDFVGKKRGKTCFVEVKYRPNLSCKEFYSMAKVLGNRKVFVITKNSLQSEDNIIFLPLEIYLTFPPLVDGELSV